MNVYQQIVVIVSDIVLIIELCFSIFLGNRNPAVFDTALFLKTFFGMSIPTFFLARHFIKKFRSEDTDTTEYINENEIAIDINLNPRN